ncbi:hypothetical protein FGO68_gene2994 [Halteria grandinella]|uniref:Uncharacterized protein n=1 Tax=Halteria grandinella TaxID=5974 RepID=A0A8J8NCD0_HALGN|nr:hypothetical protein FGO68_gene2994 [Halteria grandinella]
MKLHLSSKVPRCIICCKSMVPAKLGDLFIRQAASWVANSEFTSGPRRSQKSWRVSVRWRCEQYCPSYSVKVLQLFESGYTAFKHLSNSLLMWFPSSLSLQLAFNYANPSLTQSDPSYISGSTIFSSFAIQAYINARFCEQRLSSLVQQGALQLKWAIKVVKSDLHWSVAKSWVERRPMVNWGSVFNLGSQRLAVFEIIEVIKSAPQRG